MKQPAVLHLLSLFLKSHNQKHYERKKGTTWFQFQSCFFWPLFFFFPSPHYKTCVLSPPPLQRCVSELAEVVINLSPPFFFTSAVLQLLDSLTSPTQIGCFRVYFQIYGILLFGYAKFCAVVVELAKQALNAFSYTDPWQQMQW